MSLPVDIYHTTPNNHTTLPDPILEYANSQQAAEEGDALRGAQNYTSTVLLTLYVKVLGIR